MKKKLTHNLGLKLAALFVACCLWLISMNINDPVSQRVYTVAVQLLNMNTLTSAGKYVEVLDDTDTIRVTVRASRSVFSDFSEKNIVATADVSEMTEGNLLPIAITTTKSDSKIESITADKEYVEVDIENVMKLQKRISVKVANEPAEGYLLGNISTDQNAVIISGPESIVSKIASTAVEINVDGATSDVNITLPVHLYDADGHEVDAAKLTKSVNEVFTTASILQTKEVPLEYTATGTPQEGYLFTNQFMTEPSMITIAGKASVLKNINSIVVEDAVNLDGATGNVTSEVELKQYLPDNTILADSGFDGTASVTAVVEEESIRSFDIPVENFEIINVPEGYVAELRGIEEFVHVKFGGLAMQLNGLDVASLAGTVDVSKHLELLEETEEIIGGNYYVRASFDLPEYIYLKDGGTVHIVLEEE